MIRSPYATFRSRLAGVALPYQGTYVDGPVEWWLRMADAPAEAVPHDAQARDARSLGGQPPLGAALSWATHIVAFDRALRGAGISTAIEQLPSAASDI